jgi:microcystin-dependent protein
MAKITLGNQPVGKDPEVMALSKATWEELRKIVQLLESGEGYKYTELHQEPAKPRVGQTVYADGTDWNPGSGAGLYEYTGAAWRRLFSANGDVVGPGSATNNNIAVFDGATGKLIKDGGATIASLQNQVPVGTVLPFAGTAEPAGYLFCFGQAVSRTTYAALFTALSTTYGVGDGSTTFNLPDLRGRVPAGQDDMGGVSADRLTSPINGDTLGAVGGAEGHTLVVGEIPAHQHDSPISASDATTGPYGSNGTATTTFDEASSPSEGTEAIWLTSATGGDGAHNNVQPTIILNYVIKT